MSKVQLSRLLDVKVMVGGWFVIQVWLALVVDVGNATSQWSLTNSSHFWLKKSILMCATTVPLNIIKPLSHFLGDMSGFWPLKGVLISLEKQLDSV